MHATRSHNRIKEREEADPVGTIEAHVPRPLQMVTQSTCVGAHDIWMLMEGGSSCQRVQVTDMHHSGLIGRLRATRQASCGGAKM